MKIDHWISNRSININWWNYNNQHIDWYWSIDELLIFIACHWFINWFSSILIDFQKRVACFLCIHVTKCLIETHPEHERATMNVHFVLNWWQMFLLETVYEYVQCSFSQFARVNLASLTISMLFLLYTVGKYKHLVSQSIMRYDRKHLRLLVINILLSK